MNDLAGKLLVLLAVFFLPALLSVAVARSQDFSEPAQLPVEVMQVLELPVHISNPILLKSDQGYLLKCQVSNSLDDRIIGLTYQLLVLDSDNNLRMRASRTATLKLAGYATKNLTLRQPEKLKIRNGDRVVIAVEQLITRELVWEVLNSREALEAYWKGDSLAPEVIKMLNQVDSRPSPRVIYRRD